MHKELMGALVAALLLPSVVQASEAGDILRDSLYSGKLEAGIARLAQMPLDDAEARFGQGLLTLATGIEGLAQDLYRYGAVIPDSTAFSLFLGTSATSAGPANLNPEKVSYAALRTMLDDFVSSMDAAKSLLEAGGASGDYVVLIDPMQIRVDVNGDGEAEEAESLGAFIAPLMGLSGDTMPGPETTGGGKVKHKDGATAPDTQIGFDRADAIWLAGYSQVLAVQPDFLLAHDFEPLVNVYFHRLFPRSDLPMADFDHAGQLFVDPTTDSGIADIIAAIHNLNFKVVEPERLAGVLARLKSITALSRQNWQAIQAESDDNRELVPSPRQTSIIPDTAVTNETIAAWMETLDTADQLLDGTLLVPHWRFKLGFDLKMYFETASETDLVMLLTGYGALPFLHEGPIADGASFASANRVFGDNLWGYAFWFN